MELRTDRAKTARRVRALTKYYSGQVLTPGGDFVCVSAASCEASALRKGRASYPAQGVGHAFYPAQGLLVMPNYDLTDDGVPLRVLVIGMETGREHSLLSIAQRTEEVAVWAQGKPWREWNPHMRGVAYTLRLAFGVPVGDDEASLWLRTAEGKRIHVLNAYAMTNLLLCSSVNIGTTKSSATATMRRNCLPRLRATIGILQPTLVVSQGQTLVSPIAGEFETLERHSPNLAVCELDGHRFVWAAFYHPTRNWHRLSLPYLSDTVVPTMTYARALALAVAS